MTTEAKIKTNWKQYGKALKKAREAAGWTLRALDDITGVDFRTILRAENGGGLRTANKAKLDKWLSRQR